MMKLTNGGQVFATDKSLKADFAKILILCALIPFIATSALVINNYYENKKNSDLLNKRSDEVLNNNISLKLNSIELSISKVISSQDMASYLISPKELRGYTETLIMGQFLSLMRRHKEIVGWAILTNKKNEMLLGKNFNKNEANQGSDWHLSPKYIYTSQTISFNDHFQYQQNANVAGHVVIKMSRNIFNEKLDSLKELFLSEKGMIFGHAKEIQAENKFYFYLILFIITLTLVFSVIVGLLFLHRAILLPIQELIQEIPDYDKNECVGNEINVLRNVLASYVHYISNTKDKLFEASKKEALFQQASQLVHDIRSPLAALDVVVNEARNLPEDERMLVVSASKRIHGIANNLLSKYRLSSGDEPDLILRKCSMYSTLASIVLEKAAEYSSNEKVEVFFPRPSESIGKFSLISEGSFKRVFSNLLNNSVESLDGDKIEILISLYFTNTHACISINDNGKGIAPELLEVIFDRGKSFGKKDGSGLGLFYAKKCVEEFKGQISVKSELKKGTSILIELPLCSPPDWFISELNTKNVSEVVIFDDDESIHHLWKQKLQGSKLVHFFNSNELSQYLREDNERTSKLFLFDYEILNDNKNGLDIIHEFKLEEHAVLVTSHHSDKKVVEDCLKSKLKLLPKELAPFIPVCS